MKNQAAYDRRVISLYEGELHAIAEMLTVAGVPEHFDNGEPISDRMRVRWLIDQYLEQRGASPSPGGCLSGG